MRAARQQRGWGVGVWSTPPWLAAGTLPHNTVTGVSSSLSKPSDLLSVGECCLGHLVGVGGDYLWSWSCHLSLGVHAQTIRQSWVRTDLLRPGECTHQERSWRSDLQAEVHKPRGRQVNPNLWDLGSASGGSEQGVAASGSPLETASQITLLRLPVQRLFQNICYLSWLGGGLSWLIMSSGYRWVISYHSWSTTCQKGLERYKMLWTVNYTEHNPVYLLKCRRHFYFVRNVIMNPTDQRTGEAYKCWLRECWTNGFSWTSHILILSSVNVLKGNWVCLKMIKIQWANRRGNLDQLHIQHRIPLWISWPFFFFFFPAFSQESLVSRILPSFLPAKPVPSISCKLPQMFAGHPLNMHLFGGLQREL